MSIEAISNLDFASLRRTCSNCGLRDVCLPMGLTADQIEQLDSLIGKSQLTPRGQVLFRTGDSMRGLYLIRSGALKTTRLSADGHRQIIGFHLPGELVGADALCCKQYQSEAEALQRSRVCLLPCDRGGNLMLPGNALQHEVHRMLGRESVIDHDHLAALGRRDAVQRVALLLRSLSERRQRLRLAADIIELPMSRDDLGNYLGLAEETVSRSLTRLQRDGMIAVSRRTIRLLEQAALARLCGSAADSPQERLHCTPEACALRASLQRRN